MVSYLLRSVEHIMMINRGDMYYASRTKDTYDFISANEVTAKEQGGPFYCPCIKCDCEFGIRAINSNKKTAGFYLLFTVLIPNCV